MSPAGIPTNPLQSKLSAGELKWACQMQQSFIKVKCILILKLFMLALKCLTLSE